MRRATAGPEGGGRCENGAKEFISEEGVAPRPDARRDGQCPSRAVATSPAPTRDNARCLISMETGRTRKYHETRCYQEKSGKLVVAQEILNVYFSNI